MLHLKELLASGRVLARHQTPDKQRLLEQCAALLAQGVEAPPSALIETALVARERLSSTALGSGVALPHGRIPGEFAPMAAFFQLDSPIDFGAADGRPVDLVLAFIVPEHFTDQQLSLLAEIAELLSDPHVLADLREATSAPQLDARLRRYFERGA